MDAQEAQAVLLDKHYIPAFVKACSAQGLEF